MALNGQSGFGEKVGSSGGNEFIQYEPVDISGVKWAMITTGSAQEVFGSIHSLRNTMGVIILCAMLVVIIVALMVTSIVLRPIKNTVVMLKDIAE